MATTESLNDVTAPTAVPMPQPIGDLRVTEDGELRITEALGVRHTQQNEDNPAEI